MYPTVKALAGGGTTPGLFLINFDPTDVAYASLMLRIQGGSILIQKGTQGRDCTEECAARVWVMVCRDACGDPVVGEGPPNGPLLIPDPDPAPTIIELTALTALDDLLNAATTGLVDRMEALEAAVLTAVTGLVDVVTADTTGLVDRVEALETAVLTATTGLVDIVTADTTGLVDRVEALEGA